LKSNAAVRSRRRSFLDSLSGIHDERKLLAAERLAGCE
jgi:hypothetical protein